MCLEGWFVRKSLKFVKESPCQNDRFPGNDKGQRANASLSPGGSVVSSYQT
jgi:hypothetical protein